MSWRQQRQGHRACTVPSTVATLGFVQAGFSAAGILGSAMVGKVMAFGYMMGIMQSNKIPYV